MSKIAIELTIEQAASAATMLKVSLEAATEKLKDGSFSKRETEYFKKECQILEDVMVIIESALLQNKKP